MIDDTIADGSIITSTPTTRAREVVVGQRGGAAA
jgi:hypothetical protein